MGEYSSVFVRVRCIFVSCTWHPWRWDYEPVHHLLARLHGHAHVDTIGLHLRNAIWVLMVDVTPQEVVHGGAVEALRLRYGAVLVGQKQRLEVDNLFAKLSDGGTEGIVLRAEELNLCLEVGEPLLLTLTTLECSNPIGIRFIGMRVEWQTYLLRSRKFLRFSSSVIFLPSGWV